MIIGDRVELIPLTKEHSECVVIWRNSDEVKKNFIYRKNFTVESQNNWVDQYVITGQVVQFVIKVKENEKLIGTVYLREIDMTNKKAEFGIFIGESDYRGCGYGTEATKLICNYGFEKLQLHKIFLRVFSYNLRAISSYQNSGFVKEGYFKDEYLFDDKYEDIIFMAKYQSEEV